LYAGAIMQKFNGRIDVVDGKEQINDFLTKKVIVDFINVL